MALGKWVVKYRYKRQYKISRGKKSNQIKISEGLNNPEIVFVKKSNIVRFVNDASKDRLEVDQVVRNVGRVLSLALCQRYVKKRLLKF